MFQQFQEELENFQQAMDARDDFISCAFVVLMAHGLEGRLEGEDEKMAELENLFEVLNNKNCRALRAKPKVYIVQACRGGGDKAKNTESSATPDPQPQLSLGLPVRLMISFPPLSLTLPLPLLGVSEHRDPGETVSGDDIVMIAKDSPQTIPTYTDTLHIYSTVEGMSPQQAQGGLPLFLTHHS